MKAHIRTLRESDVANVMEIENESFDVPWDQSDFEFALCFQDNFGLIAETPEGEPLAFVVVFQNERWFQVVNIATSAVWRRRGIASHLLATLIDRLGERKFIECYVKESNLSGLNFFKSNGFFATNLIQGFYGEQSDDDAIEMAYWKANVYSRPIHD